MKILQSAIKQVLKPANTTQVTKNAKHFEKTMFCQEYWAEAVADRVVRNTSKTSVDTHGLLNGINHHFINSANPKHMDMPAINSNLTVRDMIRETDWQFKSLKPTTEKMYTYRCIGEKPEFFAEYKQYKKALDVKKGDVIIMREYAYATSDKGYASVYMPNNKGIRYEIEIPEGARVSRVGQIGSNDEIVFPRSSRFECIGTQKVKDADNDYTIIKLRYLLPEETWRA